MKSLFYGLAALLVLLSCTKTEKCPPDEILGSLSLIGESRNFLPYANIRYLEFIDSAALDTAVLYSLNSLILDSSRTVIENICLEDEERADRFYQSEHRTVDFFDLDTSRKFRIFGNLGVNEDFLSDSSTLENPVLYDELKLTVHRSNPSLSGAVATLEFVANDRGNAGRFSDSLISRLQRFPLMPSVRINDSVFQDVYEFRNGDSLSFYFKPYRGVVAFRDFQNKWWTLNKTR